MNVGALTSETTTRIRRAMTSHVEIREWYVCTRESEPVGPVSSELVARGIIAGKVPRDALVARVGDSVWQRVLRVPEITDTLEALVLQGQMQMQQQMEEQMRGRAPAPIARMP
jgi:hypothetical protein